MTAAIAATRRPQRFIAPWPFLLTARRHPNLASFRFFFCSHPARSGVLCVCASFATVVHIQIGSGNVSPQKKSHSFTAEIRRPKGPGFYFICPACSYASPHLLILLAPFLVPCCGSQPCGHPFGFAVRAAPARGHTNRFPLLRAVRFACCSYDWGDQVDSPKHLS